MNTLPGGDSASFMYVYLYAKTGSFSKGIVLLPTHSNHLKAIRIR